VSDGIAVPRAESDVSCVRWRIDERHLEHARRVVTVHATLTPLERAPALGARVWVKRETRQRTGSFKFRGALAKIASLVRVPRGGSESSESCGHGPSPGGTVTVVAASAGNHGFGVAVAAKLLGVRARVFVPRDVARVKAQGIVAAGAELVRVAGSGYDDAEAAAMEEAERHRAVFVSPYADPFVAAGNGGTLGAEIFAQLASGAADDAPRRNDAARSESGAAAEVAHGCVIVAPVGGGGLLLGLAAARDFAERRNASRGDARCSPASASGAIRLVGVQSEASPAMTLSLARGRAIRRFVGAPTLAEGLEGGVDEQVYDQVAALRDTTLVTVSERDLARALLDAPSLVGEPVEGSAAVAVAFARAHARWLAEDGPVVVVLTGGNVDADTLERARALVR
jgi:threonine dehydratase